MGFPGLFIDLFWFNNELEFLIWILCNLRDQKIALNQGSFFLKIC